MNIQPVTTTAPSRVTTETPPTRQSTPESTSATASAALTQTAAPSTKDVQPSKPELEKAVKEVSDFVKSVNNSLQFSVDDDSGRTVVKVIDSGTKELIRQIPSEEMLTIAKALGSIKGLLVQQKA
jgi:flagellar protein FlaG